MAKIYAYVSDKHENSPGPGQSVRRLRFSLVPPVNQPAAQPGVPQPRLPRPPGDSNLTFEITQPTDEQFAEFKPGQKVTISIDPSEAE